MKSGLLPKPSPYKEDTQLKKPLVLNDKQDGFEDAREMIKIMKAGFNPHSEYVDQI